MNRQQFMEAIKRMDTAPYRITVNASSDGALHRGCFLEDGLWKVYETDQKGRLRILFRSRTEEKALDYLYDLLQKQGQGGKRKRKSWFPWGNR